MGLALFFLAGGVELDQEVTRSHSGVFWSIWSHVVDITNIGLCKGPIYGEVDDSFLFNLHDHRMSKLYYSETSNFIRHFISKDL